MNENLKNLYNTLVSNGYNPPAFDQFAKDMQDEKNLRGVYSTLQKEGYTPPAFDTFKSDMGIAPAPSSSSTKKQNTLVSPTAKPLGGGIASLIKNSGAAEAAERAAADAPSYRDPHAVSSWLANIRGQAANGTRSFNERSANLLEHAKKNPLGRNTVKSGFKYNKKTGDFEQTYLTPYGTRHTNKSEADEVSRQWRDENDHSIEKQIGEAYREQERLESELEKLTNEIDRSGDKEFLNERYKQSAVAGDAGIALMGDFGVYENADYNRLNSAIRANKQRIKTLEAVRDKGGFWRGAIDTTLDPNTWLFGVPGLADATTLYMTSRKLEKNGGDASKLTEAEKSMLDNVIANNNAQGEYGDELGFMYGAGALTANALPFVAEFVATGGFSGIANAGARYGSRLAEKAAAKGITNKAAQWLIKNTGVAAGDIASGVVMANTTGVARTASDILGRNMGEVTADGRGGYEFKGGKSLGKSIYEGEAANTLEYYTEKLGEHLQLGKWLSKGAEKLGLSKLSKAIGYVGSNRWLEKGGVQDYPSEVLEEEANIVLNSLLVGDNKFSDLWDAKTQADIWGGMAFSLGFMNAPKYANTGYQAAQYYRYKHKTDKSDAAAARQIGNEQWQELKNSIDNADNSQIADVVLGISTDENLSNDGKSAAMEYVGDLLRMRGYNMGMINSVKDDMSDEGAEEERVVDTSVGSSYSDGYKAADENEAAVIGAEYNTAEENALDMFDNDTLELLDNDPVYALAQMRRDWQYTDDELSAAVDYVNAKAARDGAEQRMADDLDSEIDTARGEVTQRINGDDFMIHGAQMKADNTDGAPKRVHIISGNVTTREDGSVDAAKSSQTIVVRDAATGKVEMVSPEYIRSVDEAIDPQEEYSNAEAAARAAYEEKKARIQATAEAEETEQPQTETPQAEVKGKEEQAEIQQVEDVQGSGRQIKPQAEGENLQTETQTGAEQAAAESPIVQQEEIPVEKDKKGNVVRTLYHKVPMQRTLEDLYDGSLDQEEIDRFVENLAADAKRRLFSVENEKKPEIGNNKQAYLEAKKRHEEKLADARAEVEYYDNLQKEVLRVTQRGGQQTGVSEDLGGEPLSLEELAARFASEYKVTPESLKGETGMSGKELKGFVGLVAREDNGGVSIERLGELLARSDEWAQLGGTPEMTQEARNMLIDAYMSGNPRSYVKQQRKRFAQKEAEHEMNEIENFAQAAFGMSAEEYLAYEEQALPAIINKYAGFDFDIYYAILQEQADARTNEAEANYNNSINGNTNEQQGESNGNGGSSSVLQTERTADEQGERTSDEPEAGGQGSVGDAGLQGVGTQGTMGEDAPEPLGEKTNNGDASDSHGRNKKIEEAKAAALERRKADGIQQDDAGEAGGGAGEEAGNGEKKNVGGGQKNVGEHSVGRVSSTESTGGDSAGGSDINEEFVPIERQIIDPRTMSDEERQKRGDLLRNATEIDVTPNQIVSTKNKTARNAAEEWWDNHVGEAKWYETEVGEVEINRNSVESSLAHGYGQMKLDAITSLVDGFSNAVYLGTMPDSTRQNGVLNHYFAYPIKYNDKRCYVFCRALHDNNTNRLYVHEVFVEDKIEKGNTLQTAASQPHGGIALYRDILANVLISDGKVTKKENSVQTSIANAEAETDTDPSEAQKKAGNYKKGHAKIDGFDVTIENPKGSVRSGTDADGKQWEQEMHNTYGYILGTEGVDGDHIDVFLSDNPANGDVFVVDQVNKDGTFDEHKVMYGFASEEEARNAYLSNYEDGWTGLGAITRVSKEEFKKWVDSSHRKTKPFAEYKGIKKAEATDNAEASNSTRSAFDNLKKQASDRMLIFKEGDNYEILYEDAKKAAEILELPVQKKDGKTFVSFPIKNLDKNLPLLIREGVMVAITDELVNTKNQKAAETEAPGVTDRYEAELEQAKAQYEEYAELMKKELEQKEAKYAEMDADVETAENISNTDEDDEVFRDGRGAYTPDEVSMENDPWSKMAGYNIRSKKERASFAERERRRMVAAVTELAERLGIADDVEIVTDLSGLQGRQRRAKGIYRKSSGKITIYIPNHINVADAVATFLHEAVAHKGLRNLFGKHFDEFLDKVYANSNSEIRSAIDALAKKKKLSTRTATEEYLAGLAEKTDFEHLPYNGWLQRVKTFFIEMLSKIGIKALDTTTLTDNELRFILWRSYRYMQGKDKGIIAFVEDTAMKMKLGVGYSDKEGASGAAEVAGKTEVSAKNKKNSARSVFDNLKKQQAFDKMFLFKVGDNYEILYDDAKSASEILGLPLQEKDGKEFVSFPVKDLDKNLALLVRGGAYVAVDNNPVQELFRDSATEVRGENSEEELFRDGEEEVPDDTENADETDGGKKKSDTKALRDILMFGNLSLTERTTAAKLLYSNIQNWDKKRKADAVKAIGENIADLAKAMRLQRDFDKATVKRVHDLARVLMESGYLSDLKEQEIKRLLAAVKNSVGKNDIDASVQKVMDIMIDNMLRRGKAALSAIESVRGSKTDTRGVEVQGMLGVDGQTIVKAFKEAKKIVNPCAGKTEGENGENTAWGAAFESVYSRMDSKDQAVADEASLEYAGMQMAQQWYDDIAKSELEESEIRLELKEEHDKKSAEERRTDSYREFAASMEEAIRQNKIERAQAYFNLAGRLSDSLRGSVENALAFKEAEKQRIGEIHHAANSDMQGRSAKEHQMSSGTRKALNNLLGNYLFTPLATYMEMLRLFGAKSVNGEGYLFNRFGRGWIDARQKEIRGVRGKLELLDAKAKEVFGGKVKTWGDLIRAVGKLPKGKVSFFNGGEMQETELPQGNLMYIYMANKMLDGKMKLRKMGISEEDVAQIETAIDPRLKEIADWLQKEFLVNSRNEYNETHKRMFGASMAAIENYFPLRILNNALDVKADELDRPEVTDGISTVTGSIIKRRRNSKPLDILNADALHVILGHVSQMEHWNAYAEFNRDLNTLRSYRRFRNQVQNMETIYGNGKNLWNKFNDVCQMAAGVYKPKGDEAEKAALAVAQGVTAAAVSFRLYTALKQFASLPAYIPYTSADYLAKAMMRPDKSWEWCMENLPIFEERWKSRVSGDPRLVKSFLTAADWRRNLAANCARAGMAPNAFIDALTCSIGAYAVYNTRKKQYLKDGYSEEQAERRAIQDAEMVYNETQQSGEDAFTSTMQRDRTWWKSLFTIFRNASMSYQRQLHGALRDLGNVMSGGVDERVAFVTKQLLREKGIHPNENGEWGEADYKREEAIAKRKVRRQFVKDGLSVATFGYIMQLAWNISGYLPYLLFGDDDETKDEFWDDIWTHTFGGWLEGFTGGDVMSLAIGMLLNGEYDSWKLKKEMPVTSATYDAIGHLLKGDFGAFATNVTNLLIQVSAGVNPQSLTDGALAILDACGGDVSLANEAMLCATRILSVPQSQIDELYFDEVGIRGEEASKYTPAQLAERYALYKVKRGHFFAPWSWDDEELIEKQEEKANTSIKERLGHAEFTGVTEAYERYEKVAKEIGEQVNALKKAERDGSIKQDEGKKRMDAIKQDRNFNTYALFTNLDKVLEAMSKRYMAAKSPEEAAMYAEAIEMYRLAMLDALSADNYAELIEAISRAREINVRTQEEWRNKYKK